LTKAFTYLGIYLKNIPTTFKNLIHEHINIHIIENQQNIRNHSNQYVRLKIKLYEFDQNILESNLATAALDFHALE
jgi:hypothetical protein